MDDEPYPVGTLYEAAALELHPSATDEEPYPVGTLYAEEAGPALEPG